MARTFLGNTFTTYRGEEETKKKRQAVAGILIWEIQFAIRALTEFELLELVKLLVGGVP